MNKSTIEFQGEQFDLDEVNREAAHYLMDMILDKQEEGDNCNGISCEKIVLTEEGEMKRITYRVTVNIQVDDYGN